MICGSDPLPRCAMPPNVVWTRHAESRLGTALKRTVHPVASAVRDTAEELTAISARLALAFPDARDAIVLNYFVGFKHRPHEHILRVDLRYPNRAKTYVVKLAGADKLQRERLAWQSLRIDDTNPVFMPLIDCPAAGDLVAIAYQDAGKHIGIEETLWLETAVQRCVRFGSPSLDSVVDSIRALFGQLARVYESSHPVDPVSTGVETMPSKGPTRERHRLAESLARWGDAGPHRIRQRVDSAFPVGCSAFIDPVDFYRYLDGELGAGTEPIDVIPQVQRGLAHGDLHGRNCLVGIDEHERATFPTLFDYDSITDDNLIGWDFVELETELKIRVCESVFGSGSTIALARNVQKFETELNAKTFRCFEANSWQTETGAGDSPRDRLMSILLTIRGQAFPVLGRPRANSREWLREYLFLLGCYGIGTVRYDNQTEPQRAAAYVSAGVAAAALDALRGPRPDDLAQRHSTYQVPLSVARRWSRGNSAEERADGEKLLIELCRRYPASLQVHGERAFNLTKQNRVPEAMRVLKAIHAEFDSYLDEDTFSLWGRCHKQPGDRFLDTALRSALGSAARRSAFQEADVEYGLAVEQYEKACAVNGGFFPGINVATLTFLRAGLCAQLDRGEESRALRKRAEAKARELLDGAAEWRPTQPDDAIWMRATEAEAALILGEIEIAVERYRAALNQPECSHHHPQSMGAQLRRLGEGYRLLGAAFRAEAFTGLPLFPFLSPDSTV